MKKSGMMNPPRHSAERVTEVPANFASAASSEERDRAAVLVEDLAELRLAERERVRRRQPQRGEQQAADHRAGERREPPGTPAERGASA